MDNKKTFIAVALFFVLIASGYFMLNSPSTSTDVPLDLIATTTGSTTDSSDISNSTTGKAESVVVPDVLDGPDLVAPKFASTISSEQRASINTGLATARDALQEFPEDFNTWIVVANLYKKAGDIAMAIKVLEYASLKWPANVISYNNLGDIYMNSLKDYKKAEAAYLQQLSNNATDINAYHTLFELYTTSYKNTSAAENILLKGISALPKAYDLNVMLARFYKSAGRTAEAKVQYDAAITSAQAQGLEAIAADIQQEAIQ